MPDHPLETVAPEQLDVDGHPMIRMRVPVAMRDGTLLATDVYASRPEDLASPRPTLLERTPYDIRRSRFSDGVHANGDPVTPESGALFFVERGFIVVRQDCRGRGDSEGVFSKYTGEAADGFDTLEWVARQPWSDGSVVTAGVSYSAHVQTAAASLGGPGISAMILDSGGFASAYETGGRFGGAFELKQVVWAYRHALTSRAAEDDPALRVNLESQDLAGWFRAMPWRKGITPLSEVPEFEDFLFEQWTHEDLDEFWTQPGLYGRGHYEAYPDVPTLNISSWYDPYVRTAIDNFSAMRRLHGPRSSLVLGPWTHGARSRTYAGDVDFGSAATLDGNLGTDYLSYKYEWLQEALREGADPPPQPVSYFVMGGGTGRRNAEGRLDHGGVWRYSESWPPPEAVRTHLYLTEDLRLTAGRPQSGAVSYDFDPRNPVPTRGGAITSAEPLMHGGAFDQRPTGTGFGGLDPFPLAARGDVLTFQTAPLTAAVILAGAVEVELFLSSSAPDTDITVKLVDVHPPNADYPLGFAMNVTDGMLRCRYREGFDHATPMEPGEVYALTIPMPDSANLFAVGHRIRLDISSSNFPRADVNPNTGRRVAGDRTWQVARNTVHLGASRLVLDVLA